MAIVSIQEFKDIKEELLTLALAVEQSPVSTIVTDPSGLIEYVNRKFTVSTGYALEEVKGKNPSILKGGKTSKEIYVELWRSIKSGETWQGELHNRKKDDSLFWGKISISPVYDGHSNIIHYIALTEYIT